MYTHIYLRNRDLFVNISSLEGGILFIYLFIEGERERGRGEAEEKGKRES